ncbi:hypothetical protein Premu_2421 [Hallella multisaccharivorax DSM 17128]|uniref:Uncharacterized protein n=1 Tax=Hallella multisaccharivorax DSM 17128 TaxID=688246 RepID=F8N9X8_9BACT|nr:hypothetical protein Premu_2421 [Hallella multisaccharivorax DSM 17128]
MFIGYNLNCLLNREKCRDLHFLSIFINDSNLTSATKCTQGTDATTYSAQCTQSASTSKCNNLLIHIRGRSSLHVHYFH